MASLRRDCKRRPPFSYSLFILALVEALLWVAPLLEAQNSDKNTFTFSLCDYLERENVNLKRVAQRWRSDEDQATQRLADQADEVEAQAELLQLYTKETSAETFSLKHLSNNSCLEPRIPYGRSKRQAATVHDEQQQKDGRAYSSGGNQKGKGKAESTNLIHKGAEYLSLITICCFFLAIMPRCKGTRPLSLMGCLTYLSLTNGAQAASLDEPALSADAALAFQDEQTMLPPEGDIRSFFILAPTKALFMIIIIVTLVVYLMLCFWLSVGWLHFAKRLLFGSDKKPTHRRDDSGDLEASEPITEQGPSDTAETETRFVSSMRPGMMVDFKFKTNVLHDALIMYSSVLNLSTLRSLLFDSDDDQDEEMLNDDFE